MPIATTDTARPLGGRLSLAAALRRGGSGHDVTRPELRALLRGVADAQELSGSVGHGSALRLPPGSGLEDAAVRGDVAVLYPGRPIVLPGVEPTLRLSYFAAPIEAGPDGVPVGALFVILSPSPAAHDSLLAGLGDLLEDASFLTLLAEHAPAERLACSVARVEAGALAAH